MKSKTLQEPNTPFLINPNPSTLKVGDRVVTDFYPGNHIRTVLEVFSGTMFRSGIGLRLSGPGQFTVIGLTILVEADRCLPVGKTGKILS